MEETVVDPMSPPLWSTPHSTWNVSPLEAVKMVLSDAGHEIGVALLLEEVEVVLLTAADEDVDVDVVVVDEKLEFEVVSVDDTDVDEDELEFATLTAAI